MRNTFLLGAAGAALFLAACGGDGDTTSTSASTGSPTSSASSTSGGGGNDSSSSSSGTGGTPVIVCSNPVPPPIDQLIINEISAVGTNEWVEIANKSANPVDLCGYAVADSVKVGGPDLEHKLQFPDGTMIPAGGYVIALGNQMPTFPPTPHEKCLPNAAPGALCFDASWKISNADGEFLYILSPNDEIITSSEYPMNAVNPVNSEVALARLPDKTGDFAPTKTATPGGENKP